ncbi:MAG TPA: methyltransferase domain-containing protein, partial [Desulfuromonadales bacterium]
MNDSRTAWNSRWRDKADDSWEPDPWLVKIRPLLPVGRALDIASGRGRNSLYLAELGLSVTAVDVSDEALAQLGREAARRHLPVETRCVDLEAKPQLPGADF